ncbi:hypothetical protein [Mycobacteroides abscessus]|uniref:hypothetical protein n=1 Tax=Mycobacteroides abscessus TaxID=36809 RepID=UPI000928F18B|nr:hypothetical protein [Mycobacteroides abscessus]SHQ45727.1 Uncharacterised protein [Mycobacteroides abscessus subsp. abscessus]SKQ87469.1 Uncharacterised protein [Mycobacteroides abscessus subsp. massiliense]SLC51895.1 Uncharacterised protein [Mycobacteroides abscessus subsp. massiliense]
MGTTPAPTPSGAADDSVKGDIEPGQWVNYYPAHGGGDCYRELIAEVRGDILITAMGRKVHRGQGEVWEYAKTHV